ncbi:kelch-like, partial [Perkinsus olseni]
PVDNCIFVCGGCSSNSKRSESYLSSVEVYDPYSKAWRRAPSMSGPRVDAAAVFVGGYLYVVGGYRVDFFRPPQPLGCVEMYNPLLHEWQCLASTMQIPRFAHSLAVVDNRYLYAIGGSTRERLVSLVEVFDTHINQWVQDDLPFQSDLIYILDTTVKPHTWSVLSVRLSVGRSACGVAWLDECKSTIGIFGGYVSINGYFEEVATSEVVPLKDAHLVPRLQASNRGRVIRASRAKIIPEMLSGRADCRAVTVGSCVFLVGGYEDDDTDSIFSDSSETLAEFNDFLELFGADPNSRSSTHYSDSHHYCQAERPLTAANDKALVFDLSEWGWVKDDERTCMFTGRTCAAVCLG